MKQKFYTLNKHRQRLKLFTFLIILLGFGIGSVQAQSIDFDGTDDYITVPDNASLQLTTSLTVEAWINYDAIHPSGGSVILQKNNDAGFNLFLNPGGTLWGRIGSTQFSSASGAVTSGTWHHVAMTFDGTTKTLYLDGVVTGTPFVNSSAANTGTADMHIGLWQAFSDRDFEGRIDEVRIWNVARSGTDIMNNMNTELAGNEAGLVAYYNFNEGVPSGDNTGIAVPEIQDKTSNNNHGTMSNFMKSGTASNWVDGVPFPNNALDFDGSDYVEITHNAVLNVDETHTVEFWLKTSTNVPSGFKYISRKAAGGVGIDIIAGNGLRHVTWGDDAEYSSALQTDGNWHHYAFVARGSGDRELFIDGVSFGTNTNAFTMNTGTNNMYLGFTSNAATMELDDYRLWDVARTCGEIKANMNSELTGSETGLVAYYNFNQGIAGGDNSSPAVNTLTDASTNALDGTLIGFALTTGTSSNWVTGSTGITGVTNPQPEINVQGNSNDITDGDTSPSTTDDTDFGTTASDTKTFTIQNTGTADLTITGITVSGTNASDFTVGGIAFPATVSASGNTTFTVTFTAGGTGTRTATINIANDDCDEGTYDFAVQADGVAPGGVAGATIWLKADNGVFSDAGITAITNGGSVEQWNDASGIGKHVSQSTLANKPTYAANGINFNPMLSFDGNNDIMTNTAGLFEGNTIDDFHVYAVVNTRTVKQSSFFYENNAGNTHGFSVHLPWSDGTVYWDAGVNSGSGRLTTNFTGSGASLNTHYLWSFTSSITGGQEQSIRRNGDELVSDATALSMVGANSPLQIGRYTTSDYHHGDYAEFIVFFSDPTTADIQRVESYLSLKYGLTLDQSTAQNYVSSDGTTLMWNSAFTGASTYNHDIAGIGRDDSSVLNQKQSKSQNAETIVTIGLGTIASDNASNGNSFATDRTFLTWGSDDATLSAVDNTDIPSDATQRMTRVWQAQEPNGDIGNVQVKIDIAGTGLTASLAAGEYAILVDDDGDFSNGGTNIIRASAIAGTEITFDNVNLSNGQYFTFANVNVYAAALNFDRSNADRVDIGTVLPASSSYTKEAWVFAIGSGDRNIISSDGNPLWIQGGILKAGNGGTFDEVTSMNTFPTGVWTHVAVTYDASTNTMRLYENGSEVASNTSANNFTGNTTLIGAYISGSTFDGSIDEVRIWNVARTQAEIQANMDTELANPASETDLVAYYNFNEGEPNADNTGITAPEVLDIKGSNDGTMINFTKMGTTSNWVDGFVSPNLFITTWETTTASESITIPHTGTGYNFTVDWGDGNSETLTDADAPFTHTYTTANTYTVSISGTFPRIYFSDLGDKDKIQTIEQWGTIAWTSMNRAFDGCSNLTYNATDAPDLSGLTDVSLMFREANAFNGDISAWDMSNVENMQQMFESANSFNQDISAWDVSSVTNMRSMFSPTTSFNNGGNALTWTTGTGTSQVTTMFGMFFNADAFNQDISSWNTSSVTDARSMFGQTDIFNNGGVALDWTAGFGTSCNMSNMFNGATAFNQSLASWDISSVTDMSSMLNSSGLSTANYDATLIGWASGTIPNGITLGASGLEYCLGETARNTLTSAPNNWTISGDNLGCGDKNALNFDGTNDYVAVGNNLPAMSEFTIETWIKPESFGGLRGIVMQDNWTTGYIHCQLNDNQIQLSINGNTNVNQTLNAFTFSANTWYHIAVVYSSVTNDVKWYVNGTLTETDTYTTAGVTTTQSFAVGAWENTIGMMERFFDGDMDELRIWNVARTEAQIQATMNAELTTTECNLVAYYNFNQGVAGGSSNTGETTLNDVIGSNNGTLINFNGLDGSQDSGQTSNWVTGATGITTVASPVEINVQGNSNDIVNGSTAINTTIDTDFGTVTTANKVYTIQNTGGVVLNITSISSNSGRFTISGAPTTVAAGSSATFNVSYNSANAGADMATITINNSDCDEGTYTFAVQATAVQQNALNFDGTDDHVAGSGIDLANSDFTVEAWFNTNNTASIQTIFALGSAGAALQSLHIRIGGTGVKVGFFSGDVNFSWTATTGWHHLAVVHDASTRTSSLYIDGVFIDSDIHSGNFVGNTDFTIGRNSWNTGNRFNGSMDEVRIWNDVRTCGQIKANMNSELMGSEAGLVAYYNFNQGTAGGVNTSVTVVDDLTANNNDSNDLTTTGFTTATPSTSLNGGATSNWVTGSTGITGIPNPQPEISVSVATDGGTYDVGGYTTGTPVDFTYTITNTGSADLVLSASPVSATGTGFTVISQPANLTIPAGGSETFTVQFNPAVLGTTYTTNFAVAYTGCADYTFSLTGKAINETVDGTRGNMMSFDGTGDYINTTYGGVLGGNSRTVEAWVKPTDDGLSTVNVIQQWGTNATGGRFTIRVNQTASNGTLGALRAEVNGGFIIGSTNIKDDNWHHIAVVLDNDGTPNINEVRLYVDGEEEIVSGSIGRAINTVAGDNLVIGADDPSGSYPFKGQIDEFRIWDVARDQDDIRENMHLTLSGSESGLVGYWQFNEDSGDAVDKVTGNNGTLNGGATRTESEVAVAGGKSIRVTPGVIASHQTVSFSDANLDINFASNNNAGDEFVAYFLREAPYANVSGVNTTTNSYWVVRRFGTGASNFEIDGMEFTLLSNNEISTDEENTPSTLKLHKRGSAEFGAWEGAPFPRDAVFANNNSKIIRFGNMTGASTGDDMDMASLSQFVIVSTNNSGLPITLLNFNAQRANEKQVLLTWATAVEKDNAGFEIEMSADGENFQNVGFVAGAGNSSEIKNYELIINNSNSGYYRLKQVDLDGSFEYSDLRFVEGVTITRHLSIAPNPTNGKVQLNLENTDNNEIFTLRLLDSKGQAILDTEGNLNQINEHLNSILGRASKGLYFLDLQSERERFIERIILQ